MCAAAASWAQPAVQSAARREWVSRFGRDGPFGADTLLPNTRLAAGRTDDPPLDETKRRSQTGIAYDEKQMASDYRFGACGATLTLGIRSIDRPQDDVQYPGSISRSHLSSLIKPSCNRTSFPSSPINPRLPFRFPRVPRRQGCPFCLRRLRLGLCRRAAGSPKRFLARLAFAFALAVRAKVSHDEHSNCKSRIRIFFSIDAINAEPALPDPNRWDSCCCRNFN